jgi:hypothetical protein
MCVLQLLCAVELSLVDRRVIGSVLWLVVAYGLWHCWVVVLAAWYIKEVAIRALFVNVVPFVLPSVSGYSFGLLMDEAER